MAIEIVTHKKYGDFPYSYIKLLEGIIGYRDMILWVDRALQPTVSRAKRHVPFAGAWSGGTPDFDHQGTNPN